MTSWQKLSLLAAAALLFPFFASAQEQASKNHYDGIYKGTIPVLEPIQGTGECQLGTTWLR
jgi:hypothetical protein